MSGQTVPTPVRAKTKNQANCPLAPCEGEEEEEDSRCNPRPYPSALSLNPTPSTLPHIPGGGGGGEKFNRRS